MSPFQEKFAVAFLDPLSFKTWKQKIPSRELTYPTWGKGKSSSKVPFFGDMLVPWRVSLLANKPIIFQRKKISTDIRRHPLGCRRWRSKGRGKWWFFRGSRVGRPKGHCHFEIYVQYCYSGSKRYVLHILYGINPGPGPPLVNISTFAAGRNLRNLVCLTRLRSSELATRTPFVEVMPCHTPWTGREEWETDGQVQAGRPCLFCRRKNMKQVGMKWCI